MTVLVVTWCALVTLVMGAQIVSGTVDWWRTPDIHSCPECKHEFVCPHAGSKMSQAIGFVLIVLGFVTVLQLLGFVGS